MSDAIRLVAAKTAISGGRPAPLAEQKNPASAGRTIAAGILAAHDDNGGKGESLAVAFDALISHDITYVGIIQTAVASGLREFPVPYALTNCHNSLCAVGGTINADDHLFGLSAARRFGGIYVPPNLAVIHQYAREELARPGAMILGSDSHTRYGAIGAMGVGEGGGELVKQLLGDRWRVRRPETVLVWLTGKPRRGVGPHDVAIALCGATYKNNFAKNRILEFAGPGVASLDMDYRIGIDVMTTETACLTSIWETDDAVSEYCAMHGRAGAYRRLAPEEGAVYDAMIEIDLGKVEPMAAMPFHPSEAVPLSLLAAEPGDILREAEKRAKEISGVELHLTDKLQGGRLRVQQGVIAGCAGGMYSNLAAAAAILKGRGTGNGEFELDVYPPSAPVDLELSRSGVRDALAREGAIVKTCFCGPCFGAGDVPANDTISIRHTTRNFPNREGSRPGDGQLAAVMLMDARSIAATAAAGGVITPATEIDYEEPAAPVRFYDRSAYDRRVYSGFGRPDPATPLRYGPNIAPWPKMPELSENMLFRVASVLHDPVTTTDELIPSGETSSYRSNPPRLAEFTLSRRDPGYVARAKETAALEAARRESGKMPEEAAKALAACGAAGEDAAIASLVFAEKPGDGSAREQAASCQKVLGGGANICRSFATKRYRSNCINWGLVPFTIPAETPFDLEPGDWIYVPGLRGAVERGDTKVKAKTVRAGKAGEMELLLENLSAEERSTLLAGCLMNEYVKRRQGGGARG